MGYLPRSEIRKPQRVKGMIKWKWKMARYLETYSHNERIGVLLLLDAPDDITIRTREFKEFARNLAMHIAAGNPGNAVDESREYALLKQQYFKDESKTVLTYITEMETFLKTQLRIVKYARFATDDI